MEPDLGTQIWGPRFGDPDLGTQIWGPRFGFPILGQWGGWVGITFGAIKDPEIGDPETVVDVSTRTSCFELFTERLSKNLAMTTNDKKPISYTAKVCNPIVPKNRVNVKALLSGQILTFWPRMARILNASPLHELIFAVSLT
jgi:hypothetical protein